MRHGGARAVCVGPIEMHEMLVGLGDEDCFDAFDEKAQFFKVASVKRLFARLGVQEAQRSGHFSTDSNG